jgi:hypothetical protein
LSQVAAEQPLIIGAAAAVLVDLEHLRHNHLQATKQLQSVAVAVELQTAQILVVAL